ncbi:MAG: co-chaperone GroES [Nanoarchaeota archaeon]
MNLIPIGERVLIKPATKKEKTASGIYIPESAQEEKKEGEVISVGEGKDGKTIPIKPGDKVIYGGYSSEEIELNGVKHIFVEFKDILAKIE